jgi:hypothetical protein
MKNLKFIVIVTLALFLFDFSTELFAQEHTYTYAYVSIEGKLFSKKLKVTVDLGDTPEQIKAGEEFSKKLSDKKSYAAVLNYMVGNEFELIETLSLEDNSSYQGTGSGGTSGIIFIMRKTITNNDVALQTTFVEVRNRMNPKNEN